MVEVTETFTPRDVVGSEVEITVVAGENRTISFFGYLGFASYGRYDIAVSSPGYHKFASISFEESDIKSMKWHRPRWAITLHDAYWEAFREQL